ncbi:phage baseplate assembly protein, partial [Xanthobacter sp. DSM 24535]|uniref:phage baseplate assembly protein domain-containing protein n=1 Tax=Roseixanthobacter psychrophilus TaxID=3119917 RepID=UPI003729DF2E
MTDRETAYLIRAMVSRGVVSKSDDSQETQTVDVAQWAGVERTAVEVMQPFGIASRAPANGLVLLLAVGGDQGDLVALPVGAPGSRLGNLAEGEVALYTTDGSRVLIRADGAIEVTSSQSVDVKVPGKAR